MTGVKTFERVNKQSNLYVKQEPRNTYEPHQQFNEHQVPDLGQVQTIAAGLNILTVSIFTLT